MVLNESTPTVLKAEGVTESERYLQRLCEKSFLSLWTYAGVYRDQGKQSAGSKGKTEGKEVCDLVVVFGDHVILFSDKNCSFPDTGDLDTDWKRWYKKAVKKSADQLWGAERWFRDYPNRLYLDPACEHPFPISLPDRSIIRLHRIAVARGAGERCRKHYGGSGSLMLYAPWFEQVLNQVGKELPPFAIGAIEGGRGFVHVFDDVTLEIVLRTLDTADDFIRYLERKERFVNSRAFQTSTGEEELLAFYMQGWTPDGELDFVVPTVSPLGPYAMPHPVILLEGGWKDLTQSMIWRAFEAWNKVSYFWDGLVEKLAKHTIRGSLYKIEDPSPHVQEILLRFLAAEPRHRRRRLSVALLGQLERAETNDILDRSARVIPSSTPAEPTYIFLIVGTEDGESHDNYRERRRALLQHYCVAAKHVFPDGQHFIAIGTEPKDIVGRTEDILYLDASHWTDEMAAEAALLHNEYGLLRETKTYPHPLGPRHYLEAKAEAELGNHIMSMKVGRNERCPCGSGRKYKQCHGKP